MTLQTTALRDDTRARHKQDVAMAEPTTSTANAWRVAYNAGDRTRGLVEGAALSVRYCYHSLSIATSALSYTMRTIQR